MIEIIEKVKGNINFHELNMRIGVHTGKVIGGVIGTDIVRYDIYGEDVLIANKMESKG
jgi:class 3 adenylate cyclase